MNISILGRDFLSSIAQCHRRRALETQWCDREWERRTSGVAVLQPTCRQADAGATRGRCGTSGNEDSRRRTCTSLSDPAWAPDLLDYQAPYTSGTDESRRTLNPLSNSFTRSSNSLTRLTRLLCESNKRDICVGVRTLPAAFSKRTLSSN